MKAAACNMNWRDEGIGFERNSDDASAGKCCTNIWYQTLSRDAVATERWSLYGLRRYDDDGEMTVVNFRILLMIKSGFCTLCKSVFRFCTVHTPSRPIIDVGWSVLELGGEHNRMTTISFLTSQPFVPEFNSVIVANLQAKRLTIIEEGLQKRKVIF